MEMIRLKYVGGKSLSKLYYNRVRYIFNRENDFTTEVPIGAWNFVKQTNEFVPAPVAEKSVDLPDTATISTEETKLKEKFDRVCDICGFKAKTVNGKNTHKRIKHKEGK